jgi:hypothetical protein
MIMALYRNNHAFQIHLQSIDIIGNKETVLNAYICSSVGAGFPCPLWAGKPSPYRRRLLILIPIISNNSTDSRTFSKLEDFIFLNVRYITGYCEKCSEKPFSFFISSPAKSFFMFSFSFVFS